MFELPSIHRDTRPFVATSCKNQYLFGSKLVQTKAAGRGNCELRTVKTRHLETPAVHTEMHVDAFVRAAESNNQWTNVYEALYVRLKSRESSFCVSRSSVFEAVICKAWIFQMSKAERLTLNV